MSHSGSKRQELLLEKTMSQVSVPSTVRTYDIICFGDEVPGILALVCAVREYYRQKNQYPRTLLLFKGNAKVGIGGHLVRGRLSYLNRCVVPPAIRQSLNLEMFGDPQQSITSFCNGLVWNILLSIQTKQMPCCEKCCMKRVWR